MLKPWYDLDRGEANKSRGNIFEYYTDSERFKRFSHHISGFTRRENTITIESLVGLINPVTWAERNKDQSRFHTYWNTLVHGDLHSGNIIVDDEAHTYIIDYERTGPGYYLRDFVELEKDVRLRLLRLEDDETWLNLHLDLVMMRQMHPDRLPKWEELPFYASTITEEKKQELRKAFIAVCSIRRAAHRIAGLTDMREYYWALLMETLISATDSRIASAAQQRAILSASIICERLDLWNRPQREWPPSRIRSLFRSQSEHWPTTKSDRATYPCQEVKALLKRLATNKSLLNQLKSRAILSTGGEAAALSVQIEQEEDKIGTLERQIGELDPDGRCIES